MDILHPQHAQQPADRTFRESQKRVQDQGDLVVHLILPLAGQRGSVGPTL
jgi:hypothetical protein